MGAIAFQLLYLFYCQSCSTRDRFFAQTFTITIALIVNINFSISDAIACMN
ncbi:MAG: hypothetical protein SW833_00875 [Cyanobacteriota bacterium]|nr:hypothetical protein [Cyanobacteriota bacterium]